MTLPRALPKVLGRGRFVDAVHAVQSLSSTLHPYQYLRRRLGGVIARLFGRAGEPWTAGDALVRRGTRLVYVEIHVEPAPGVRRRPARVCWRAGQRRRR